MSKFYYVEIPEKDIHPLRVKIANRTADYCVKNFFGFRRPRIRWFKETTEADFRVLSSIENIALLGGIKKDDLPNFSEFDGPVKGFFTPTEDFADSIFLREDLGSDELKETLCHELFHFDRGVETAKDEKYRKEGERNADKFADQLMLELNKIVWL